MASWGDIAVGEYRGTSNHPSKSATIGLLAAAVGITRDDDAWLGAIASAYGFAVRVDAPGVLVRDYHTTQVPPSGTGRNKRTFATRKDELSSRKENLNTILSTRDYRCDALYTVAIWAQSETPPYSLAELEEKLRRPTFVLYAGRKSCPLSLPLQPRVVTAQNLRDAFSQNVFKDEAGIFDALLDGVTSIHWEGDDEGLDKSHTVLRRDFPTSRRRWQFEERTEHSVLMNEREKE